MPVKLQTVILIRPTCQTHVPLRMLTKTIKGIYGGKSGYKEDSTQHTWKFTSDRIVRKFTDFIAKFNYMYVDYLYNTFFNMIIYTKNIFFIFRKYILTRKKLVSLSCANIQSRLEIGLHWLFLGVLSCNHVTHTSGIYYMYPCEQN